MKLIFVLLQCYNRVLTSLGRFLYIRDRSLDFRFPSEFLYRPNKKKNIDSKTQALILLSLRGWMNFLVTARYIIFIKR